MKPARITAALAERQAAGRNGTRDGLSWLAETGLTDRDTLARTMVGDGASLFGLLVAVGRGDLAAGRLFEGHVDALGLVQRLGTEDQRVRVAALVAEGRLLGIWGADDPDAPARIEATGGGYALSGRKTYASGAHGLGGALVAAKDPRGATRLVLLGRDDLAGRFDPDWWDPIGMAETCSDAVDLGGLRVPEGAVIGAPGAYEGHPAFGAGAIRFVAVQLGGLLGVWDAMREHLSRTDRTGDPHQAMRLAEAVAEAEAAYALTRAAFARLAPVISWSGAGRADESALRAADAARLGVRRASERTTELAIRSVGCGGLMRRHPLSRRVTDLMVYLCQPAPDAAAGRLGKAAGTGSYVPLFDADGDLDAD